MGYTISAYFDPESNRLLSRCILGIANASGNDFMTANSVPPHLTIAFFEAQSEETAKLIFQNVREDLKPGTVVIPSVGVFFPNVIFAEAVLNAWLLETGRAVNEELKLHDGVAVNRYYRPFSWIPHITLGKTLSEEQMRAAFSYLQKHFCPVTAKVERFGLSRTGPHRELLTS